MQVDLTVRCPFRLQAILVPGVKKGLSKRVLTGSALPSIFRLLRVICYSLIKRPLGGVVCNLGESRGRPETVAMPCRRCAISIIYLIRHGETDWNQDKRIQGQTDIPLNARGRRQAEALAGRLSTVSLEMIYTSDLTRARETAEIIAARQPAEGPRR